MGRYHFQEVWMQEDQYKTWLACVSDVTARCTVCLKNIDLSNMGEGALRSHFQSEKHKSRLKNASKAMPMSLLHLLGLVITLVLSFVPLTITLT